MAISESGLQYPNLSMEHAVGPTVQQEVVVGPTVQQIENEEKKGESDGSIEKRFNKLAINSFEEEAVRKQEQEYEQKQKYESLNNRKINALPSDLNEKVNSFLFYELEKEIKFEPKEIWTLWNQFPDICKKVLFKLYKKFEGMRLCDLSEETLFLLGNELIAEGQNPIARLYLGVRYEKGIGFLQNWSRAFQFYLLAANQGLARAQNNLGACYSNGQGVEKNLSEAVRWYRLAANQGLAFAQKNLGNCYYYGKGVEKNLSEAVRWYQLAADQGDAQAQNNLGVCYFNGKGVEKNLSEAVRWYRLAANQGLAQAQNKLNRINKKNNKCLIS